MYDFNKATIYKGRAVQIPVCFVDSDKQNLPTCGITGSTVKIENQDGSFIEKAAATGIAWGVVCQTYMYIYQFTPEETALFLPGNDLSLYLTILFGENHYKYEFKKFLTVVEEIF